MVMYSYDKYDGYEHGQTNRQFSTGAIQDRELSHGPYSTGHRHTQDTRASSLDHNESNATMRRRIPVACGRCRKRKIRCSGDPGNGGACTNCKSAGHDKCQFLRVQSTEASFIKNDSHDSTYENTAAVSRLRVNVPTGSSYYPAGPAPSTLDLNGFRQNSMTSSYDCIKSYQGATYDTTDETYDYGLQAPTYNYFSTEDMSSPYAGNGAARKTWTAAQDSSFTFSPYHLPYSNRVGTNESKNLPFSEMNNSLPSALGPERILPCPPSRQQFNTPLLRLSENQGSIYSGLRDQTSSHESIQPVDSDSLHGLGSRTFEGSSADNHHSHLHPSMATQSNDSLSQLYSSTMIGNKSLDDNTNAHQGLHAYIPLAYVPPPPSTISMPQTDIPSANNNRLFSNANSRHNSCEDLRYIVGGSTQGRKLSSVSHQGGSQGSMHSPPSRGLLHNVRDYIPPHVQPFYPSPPMLSTSEMIQAESPPVSRNVPAANMTVSV